MEETNKKQKEFWSGAGGDVWVDKQREMDIMLNPLGKNAINKIDFSDKLTILDIGCGCGDTSLDIAKKVPKKYGWISRNQCLIEQKFSNELF